MHDNFRQQRSKSSNTSRNSTKSFVTQSFITSLVQSNLQWSYFHRTVLSNISNVSESWGEFWKVFILPKLISSTLKRISSFGTLFSAKFGKRDPRHRSNGKFKTVNCHVCSIDSARGSGIPLQARHNTVEGRYLIVAGRDYARPQQWASLCEEKRGEMVSRGLNKSRPIGYRRLNKEYRAGSMPSANIFCYALLFLPKLVFPPRLRPSDSFSFPNIFIHRRAFFPSVLIFCNRRTHRLTTFRILILIFWRRIKLFIL